MSTRGTQALFPRALTGDLSLLRELPVHELHRLRGTIELRGPLLGEHPLFLSTNHTEADAIRRAGTSESTTWTVTEVMMLAQASADREELEDRLALLSKAKHQLLAEIRARVAAWLSAGSA